MGEDRNDIDFTQLDARDEFIADFLEAQRDEWKARALQAEAENKRIQLVIMRELFGKVE